MSRPDEALSVFDKDVYRMLRMLFTSSSEYIVNYLDQPTLSGLRIKYIRLDKYGYDELVKIFRYRCDEAFKEGAVPDETIETTADMVASYGNARYKLDLLTRAGLIAEATYSSYVSPEHVRIARNDMPPSIPRYIISELDIHGKVILASLAYLILTNESAYVSGKSLREEYETEIVQKGHKPKDEKSYMNVINELLGYRLISKRISGKGVRGRRTLIGLPSMPAKFILDHIDEIMKL